MILLHVEISHYEWHCFVLWMTLQWHCFVIWMTLQWHCFVLWMTLQWHCFVLWMTLQFCTMNDTACHDITACSVGCLWYDCIMLWYSKHASSFMVFITASFILTSCSVRLVWSVQGCQIFFYATPGSAEKYVRWNFHLSCTYIWICIYECAYIHTFTCANTL